MKRAGLFRCVLAGLLLCTLPLPAALYRSNSIGQELEPIDPAQRESHRYVLQVDGEGTALVQKCLYDHGDMVYCHDIESHDKLNARQTVTERYYDESGQVVRTVVTMYENGLPRQVSRSEGGSVYHTLFAYADGRLVETKELVDGELALLATYFRGSEGMLSALRVIGTEGPVSQGLFSKLDGIPTYGESVENAFMRLRFYPGNLVVQDRWSDDKVLVETAVSRDEAGRLVVEETKDGVSSKKTYGPDGMLVRVHGEQADGTKTTVTYQYDQLGVLDQSVETVEGAQVRKIERWYAGGVLQTTTEWVDSVPVKATRFRADGTSVVTLFEGGRPYADVTYAPDGKRVLSLEYRKEQ